MKSNIVGIDIGGTKCAISHYVDGEVVEIGRIPTGEFQDTFRHLGLLMDKLPSLKNVHFGISCGGPLDIDAGRILNPPNLPTTWQHVEICSRVTEEFGGKATLMNDANACALAEWKFGGGRGCAHMAFLTSGTGMGAGLILNGRLYEGATGDAGEIGHVRLSSDGPIGFGKAGSVEGYTSGGGIVRLAMLHLERAKVPPPSWAQSPHTLTTKQIADAAHAGDSTARAIMGEAGGHLGEALAILIDLLNPERVVIGGFYPHCRALMDRTMRESLAREALASAVARCEILPSQLGDTIGSYGAVAAVLHKNAEI